MLMLTHCETGTQSTPKHIRRATSTHPNPHESAAQCATNPQSESVRCPTVRWLHSRARWAKQSRSSTCSLFTEVGIPLEAQERARARVRECRSGTLYATRR